MRHFKAESSSRFRGEFQKHHIIPIEICKAAHFLRLFERIEKVGFDANDFSTNGIWLPCNERSATTHCLPLHRGPHRLYNEMVKDNVALILEKIDKQNFSDAFGIHKIT